MIGRPFRPLGSSAPSRQVAVKKSSKVPNVTAFRDMIRNAGLRSTQARIAILERLHTTPGPVTHAEVADDLESRGFDKATIYRSLIELAEAGLLARMELGDHVWRYELRGSHNPEEAQHLHFLCLDCGRIECLTGATVDTALAPLMKRVTSGTISEVLLKGHCRQCK
jgi:Fur family transcriptional regulator, ferric uptake regulator